jgi:hypothetical protein
MDGDTQSGYPPNTGFYYENIDFSKLQKQWRRYPTPHPPIELCRALVPLVFFHMFFVPACFCMKPRSMVPSTYFFNSAKEISNVL